MRLSIRFFLRLTVHFLVSLVLLVGCISLGLAVVDVLVPEGGARQDNGVIICVAVLITIYILVCGWYFGLPLIYVIGKIQRLAHGIYRDPVKFQGLGTGEGRKIKAPYSLLKELILQMQALSETLERSERERGRLNELQKEWMAGISHDLKTPLTYIKGYADMLLSSHEWTAREQAEFITEIQTKASHMEELIGDLSLTFRLEGQEMPLHLVKKELVEYVRRIVADVANDPRAVQCHIGFEANVSRAVLRIDEKLLQRSLHNLIINAVLHNPPGTHVRIQMLKRTSFLAIAITDDGTGMDEDTVAQLFHKYFRGTTTEKYSEGTGLGMAIADQIVRAHKGSINVSSRVGEGTTITVSLPLGK
ncbi:sensor histidine kinase [Paenibacillus sp. A14]|uniref:sensor histidine kinase n=1 Tax=Paenibacillus sp. A14 TaxID=3119820 RepID=UPI002FE3887E